MNSRRLWLLIGLACLILSAVAAPAAAQGESIPASEHDPSIAVKWMELLYERAEAEAISAPAAARLYAYAGATIYQAVMPGIPENFSLSGQLPDLPEIPYPDEGVYDWPSSANGAMSTLLMEILPQTSQRYVTVLRQSELAARKRDVDEEIVDRSMKYGEQVGKLMLEWVATDGYEATRDLEFEMSEGDPSLWVYTSEGQTAVEPYWGMIRPFALYGTNTCDRPLGMEFSSDENSTFYKQAVEVMETGNNLTDEQRESALFWVDTPGQTGTPAGHWVMIENQIVDALDLSLGRASEMYALVGLALGDAFIAAWNQKYQVLLLRPETYIQQYLDENWKPLVATPGFPEYPSGHSVVSGAAAEVLTTMFGTVAFTDQSGRRHGFEDRSFLSFQHAASEAAMSRMYGGIHFRAAIENGLRMGQCIGRNVLDYVQLRSIPQGE